MLPSASQIVVWYDTAVCHAGPHRPRVPTFPCTGRQPSHSDEYAADRTAKARLAPGARSLLPRTIRPLSPAPGCSSVVDLGSALAARHTACVVLCQPIQPISLLRSLLWQAG
jgi:hypothetical protein